MAPAPHRGSVPASGEVLEPEPAAKFTFTLSEIFDSPHPKPRPSPPVPPRAQDPRVAAAMARGEALFPDVMKASGPAIAKALSAILPATFESLSRFSTEDLTRIADLITRVSTLTEAFHRIDAAARIRTLASRAERLKAKPSLLDRMGLHEDFDPGAASESIAAMKGALTTVLLDVEKALIDVERATIPLKTAVSALQIVLAMTKTADQRDLIKRRIDLLTSSATEAEIATKQLENLRKLAQENILQCDELKNVTLPAVGFRESL